MDVRLSRALLEVGLYCIFDATVRVPVLVNSILQLIFALQIQGYCLDVVIILLAALLSPVLELCHCTPLFLSSPHILI